jgi:uncharacterized protein
MGHRHSSEEFRGEGAVCGDCGRVAAGAEEIVNGKEEERVLAGRPHGLQGLKPRSLPTSYVAALRSSGLTKAATYKAAEFVEMATTKRSQIGEETTEHSVSAGVSELALRTTLRGEGPASDPSTSLRAGGGRYKSWGVRVALLVLDLYKVYLSPWMAGGCRYEPTCSRYAYDAIERFGVARGVWLGTKRLLRCHPFTKRFGFDPVPEKWEEMRSRAWEKSVEFDRPEDRPLHGGVRS